MCISMRAKIEKKVFSSFNAAILSKSRKCKKFWLFRLRSRKELNEFVHWNFFKTSSFDENFICHILIRAHNLRFEIIQFCVKWNVNYLLLKNEKWSQIEYFIELLKSFCLFIKILNMTHTITINIVFKIYNRLFEHLKRAKSRFARKRVTWKKSLIDVFTTIETKLIKYYN